MGFNRNICVATIYAFTALFSLLALALYILGAARYLTNLEDNTCEMTYMFEYPQYVKISMDESTEANYPRFALYAYGEGFVTEKHRRMKFSGIPVLFVPGNAGSHEQVRSLASVSLRKTMKDRKPYHFDYFTVSLGKDYSALYGGILDEQTKFVTLSIYRILQLYEGDVQQIVLIGHSMGGVVAKGALARDTFRWNNSTGVGSILVTLASSHSPIFLPDRTIANYYQKTMSLMETMTETGTITVSIGGGQRDVVVSTSQMIDPLANLNAISSAVPDVWRSTDHLCILWCKQLVLTIVRALIDCVDTNARPPRITFDRESKIRALNYHFKSRNSGKKMQPYKDVIEFERGAEWIEDIRRRFTWTSKERWNTKKNVFLMFRLEFGTSPYNTLTIDSINLDVRDWLFACSAHAIEGNSRVCEWAWNLTNQTRLTADPLHRLRKTVDLNLYDVEELKNLRGSRPSHIVVRIPVSVLRDKKDDITMHFDLYRRGERIIHLQKDASALSKCIWLDRIFSDDSYTVLTSKLGETRYEIVLDQIPDAVSVDVESLESVEDNNDDNYVGKKRAKHREPPQALLELNEAPRDENGGNFEAEYTTTQVRTLTFNTKDGEFTRKRLVMHLATRGKAILKIRLNPEFLYRITIRRANIVERVACLVRERWPNLHSILVALCFLVVATRMNGTWRLKNGITIGVMIVTSIFRNIAFETLVAIGLLHVFAVTICCLVVFCGSLVNNTIARLFSRITLIPSTWFTWILCALDHAPFVLSLIFIVLITSTCGGIAVLLIVPLHFLKLTRMYDDYLEHLFMASLRHCISFGQRRRKRNRRIVGAGSNSTISVPLLEVADEMREKQEEEQKEEQQQQQEEQREEHKQQQEQEEHKQQQEQEEHKQQQEQEEHKQQQKQKEHKQQQEQEEQKQQQQQQQQREDQKQQQQQQKEQKNQQQQEEEQQRQQEEQKQQQQQQEEQQQEKQKQLQQQQEEQKQQPEPKKKEQEQKQKERKQQDHQKQQLRKLEKQEKQKKQPLQRTNNEKTESAVVSKEPINSRQVILDQLLLFVTWSIAVLPAIPSALMWAKNFTYDPFLYTEDFVMRISWIFLTCCACVGVIDIEPSMNRYEIWSHLCGDTLRCFAWVLLYTASIKDSAYHQWTVPVFAAAAIYLLSLRGRYREQ